MDIEARQRTLFDALADNYEAHYDDATSQAYRDRFIHGRLFHGVPLRGARVLDAMCASGETTRFLLAQEAAVDGLDISGNAIERYRRRWPSCRGYAASMLNTELPDASYDVVTIVGGLHHLHPRVARGMDEVHRLLKPGGYFCFLEPHRGSWADVFRRMWYRRDAMFEENEAAVDIEGLEADNADRFEFLGKTHLGTIAYLTVLQSMIFRVPTWLKPLYAPPAVLIETLLQPFQGRRFSCVTICCWRKRQC